MAQLAFELKYAGRKRPVPFTHVTGAAEVIAQVFPYWWAATLELHAAAERAYVGTVWSHNHFWLIERWRFWLLAQEPLGFSDCAISVVCVERHGLASSSSSNVAASSSLHHMPSALDLQTEQVPCASSCGSSSRVSQALHTAEGLLSVNPPP